MKSTHASHKSRAIRFLWLLEVVIIVGAVLGSAWLRFLNDHQTHLEFVEHAPARALLVALSLTGAMAAFGLYQVHMRHSRMDFFLRFLMSFVLGGIALVVLYYIVPQAYIGRGVLALSLLLSAGGIVAVRMLSVSLFRTDVLKQRILVLGAGNNCLLYTSPSPRDS